MIDTDKYEGHTEGPWAWNNVGVLRGEESHSWVLWVDFTEPDPYWHIGSAVHVGKKNKELIADAPLLLEAYKELREWKAEVERICRTMSGPNRDTALFIMTNEVEEE